MAASVLYQSPAIDFYTETFVVGVGCDTKLPTEGRIVSNVSRTVGNSLLWSSKVGMREDNSLLHYKVDFFLLS